MHVPTVTAHSSYTSQIYLRSGSSMFTIMVSVDAFTACVMAKDDANAAQRTNRCLKSCAPNTFVVLSFFSSLLKLLLYLLLFLPHALSCSPSLILPSTPRLHHEHHKERVARAKALSKLYGGNTTVVYTDTANHSTKLASCES